LGVADRNARLRLGLTARGKPRPALRAERTDVTGPTTHGSAMSYGHPQAHECTTKIPVTGSGAAQSLRPVCVARRERLRDFGLIASTSAVPPREPSRRKWRLAARCGFPAAHIPRRVRQASMRRRSAGTHPKWKKNKKARILRGVRASGNQRAAGASIRRGSLPDGSDPRTRDARTTARRAARTSAAGRRTRTHASRRGLWRCEGRSGCSRWCPGSFPFRSAGVEHVFPGLRFVQKVVAFPSDSSQCK